jgi:hypothetical protein
MKKFYWLSFLVTLVWLASPSMATIVWTGNLLTNPGAESGDLTGWTTDDAVVVVASQYQDQTTGRVEEHSGDWFFNMCGASVGDGGVVKSRLLSQSIDLTGYAAGIDAGVGLINASTWLQTEDIPPAQDPDPSDMAQMSVLFFDALDTQIGSATTGLVTTAPPNLRWLQYTLSNVGIPIGARSVQLELLGEKHETTYVNAFFDDVSLQVGIPEPATICLFGLGGLLLRKRKNA